MDTPLITLINTVRMHKGHPPVSTLDDTQRLREDLGFDSLDLAELTARIDERFHVDVFAHGVVRTVGEIRAQLKDI